MVILFSTALLFHFPCLSLSSSPLHCGCNSCSALLTSVVSTIFVPVSATRASLSIPAVKLDIEVSFRLAHLSPLSTKRSWVHSASMIYWICRIHGRKHGLRMRRYATNASLDRYTRTSWKNPGTRNRIHADLVASMPCLRRY